MVMLARRLWRISAVVLTLALLAAAPASRAAGTAETTMREFYGTLLETMKKGQGLGERGRYFALEPAVKHTFDLGGMSERAVGPAAWGGLSTTQRQQLAEAFTHYTVATYADRFDSWSGERLEIMGERKTAYGTLVQTQIVDSAGKPTAIDYLMKETGDGWRVADVYLTGTISQLATLRSQFVSVLRDQGVDALIARLNRKADLLQTAAVRRD